MKLLSMGQIEVNNATILDAWTASRIACEEKIGKAECDRLLGTQPIYFPPAHSKIPFWTWLIVGYILGKQI